MVHTVGDIKKFPQSIGVLIIDIALYCKQKVVSLLIFVEILLLEHESWWVVRKSNPQLSVETDRLDFNRGLKGI